jgi:hypothetical protein
VCTLIGAYSRRMLPGWGAPEPRVYDPTGCGVLVHVELVTTPAGARYDWPATGGRQTQQQETASVRHICGVIRLPSSSKHADTSLSQSNVVLAVADPRPEYGWELPPKTAGTETQRALYTLGLSQSYELPNHDDAEAERDSVGVRSSHLVAMHADEAIMLPCGTKSWPGSELAVLAAADGSRQWHRAAAATFLAWQVAVPS